MHIDMLPRHVLGALAALLLVSCAKAVEYTGEMTVVSVEKPAELSPPLTAVATITAPHYEVAPVARFAARIEPLPGGEGESILEYTLDEKERKAVEDLRETGAKFGFVVNGALIAVVESKNIKEVADEMILMVGVSLDEIERAIEAAKPR